jgi:hypothetical protein
MNLFSMIAAVSKNVADPLIQVNTVADITVVANIVPNGVVSLGVTNGEDCEFYNVTHEDYQAAIALFVYGDGPLPEAYRGDDIWVHASRAQPKLLALRFIP